MAHADARTLRLTADRAMGEALPTVLATLAVVMLVNTVVDAMSIGTAVALPIVALDLSTSVICVLLHLAWKRRPELERFTDEMGMGLTLLVAFNALWTMARTKDLLYTGHVVLIVIGASMVFRSARCLIACAGIVCVCWLAVALGASDRKGLYPHSFALVAATSIAAVLLYARLRAHARIGLLRARDRVRGDRLRRALDDSRREIAQRVCAEEDRERVHAQLMQAQKLEAVGRLAGGVAHDMNNVLASISTLAQLLLAEGHLNAEGTADLESILAAARRGAQLTRNLLGFSRQGKYARVVVDPAEIIEGVRHMLDRTLPKDVGLQVVFAHEEGRVEGDPNQLAQAIVNLCINAADAMPRGGILRIGTRRVELDDTGAERRGVSAGAFLMVSVTDTGSGMNEETLRLAFEPFFTTKPQGKGTGLGLAMVYGTARNHGGHAEIESRVGEGTTVTMLLPRVACAKEPEEAAPPPSTSPVRGRSVLLVDDEQGVRNATRRILERRGMRVVEVEDGRQALETYDQKGPFDLVVLDMAMPVMGGAECFRRLRTRWPDVRVLFLSGFAPEADPQSALDDGALGFVQKPFTFDGLLSAVHEALSAPR